MFPIDALQFYDGGLVLIDSQVAKTIGEASIAPAFPNDEKSGRLPPSAITTRFLTGMQCREESFGEDAFGFFEGLGHGLEHFLSRKDVALDCIIFPGLAAGPVEAVLPGVGRGLALRSDDAYLSRGCERILPSEKVDGVLRAHSRSECEKAKWTIADVGIGLGGDRSDTGLGEGDDSTDADDLGLHCDTDLVGIRIDCDDGEGGDDGILLGQTPQREKSDPGQEGEKTEHDVIRFLKDKMQSIGLGRSSNPVMSRILHLVGVLALFTSFASSAEKPNILMIAIDDQNDWIGYLEGHPDVKTPHIDALAKTGTAFTNAHCQSPLCNPSRTSLMLSKRPGSTGIYGLSPWFRDVPELAELESLPQYLKRHGYRTYTAGKIYHGGYGRRPKDTEWDEIGPGATAKPFPPKPMVKSPSGHKLMDWGVFDHEDEDKGDFKIASWTVDKLDSMPKDEPFFLSCGFFLPHVPCFATQKWFDLYPVETTSLPIIKRDDRKDTPRFSWYLHWKLPEPRLEFLEDADEWLNLTRSYLACTSFVDDQVRRVMDAVDRNGLRENTIIVLWSDHGWHIGEKEITGKNTLWDDGTRVPLIFAGPGVVAGQVCGQPTELLDIYPTLAALAGLPEKSGLEGISLVPQLEDASTKRARPAITTHNAGNHGIRSENWRYITYADGSEELYDMVNDPNEWTNLASDPKYADVLEEHRKFIPKGDLPPAPNSKNRILIYEDGKVNWEGNDVGADDPIPEITR